LEGTLESLIASYSDSKFSSKQNRDGYKPKSIQGSIKTSDVQTFGYGNGGVMDSQMVDAAATAASTEVWSNGRSEFDDQQKRFVEMKKEYDTFRDSDAPLDITEDPFRDCLPISTTKNGLNFSPVKFSCRSVPSVVTYPETGGEELLDRKKIQNRPSIEGTSNSVEYFAPSSSPGTWLNPDNVITSPAFPLRTPTKIFNVEGNFASELTKHKHWTEEEDEQLRVAVQRETAHGERHDWKRIAKTYFGNTRAGTQCKVRWKNHLKPGITRGQWKVHEDETILFMVQQGYKWAEIAHRLPGRIGENVRERYVNFLDPSLKKSPWTEEEDAILFENQAILGNSWSAIRKLLPGRSENSIKNRYHNRKNSHLRKLKREAEEREMREAGFIAPWDGAAV
jgi:hypothetical protein